MSPQLNLSKMDFARHSSCVVAILRSCETGYDAGRGANDSVTQFMRTLRTLCRRLGKERFDGGWAYGESCPHTLRTKGASALSIIWLVADRNSPEDQRYASVRVDSGTSSFHGLSLKAIMSYEAAYVPRRKMAKW